MNARQDALPYELWDGPFSFLPFNLLSLSCRMASRHDVNVNKASVHFFWEINGTRSTDIKDKKDPKDPDNFDNSLATDGGTIKPN